MKEAKLREDLRKCVLCGGCKALCPTYGQDHVEPLSGRGRMILLRALMEGEIGPSELLIERIFSCLLCGMCEAACPVGVEVTEAVYHGRRRLRDFDRSRGHLRRLLAFALKRPHLSFRAARLLGPILSRFEVASKLPFKVTLPSEPLRKGIKLYRPKRARGRVAVFAGCAVNFIYPHLGESLISVLFKAGYEVVLPGGEVCCGAPLRAAGLEEEARGFAQRNLEAFSKLQAQAILSLCPTCTLALKKQYRNTVGQGLEKAMDVTEFLLGNLELSPLREGGRAAYHDPCHLAFGLGVKDEPREVIRRLGYSLMDTEPGACCGFSLSFTHREMSDGLLASLPAAYGEAETLITACPGCMAQLSRGHRRVIHIIEAADADSEGV